MRERINVADAFIGAERADGEYRLMVKVDRITSRNRYLTRQSLYVITKAERGRKKERGEREEERETVARARFA